MLKRLQLHRLGLTVVLAAGLLAVSVTTAIFMHAGARAQSGELAGYLDQLRGEAGWISTLMEGAVRDLVGMIPIPLPTPRADRTTLYVDATSNSVISTTPSAVLSPEEGNVLGVLAIAADGALPIGPDAPYVGEQFFVVRLNGDMSRAEFLDPSGGVVATSPVFWGHAGPPQAISGPIMTLVPHPDGGFGIGIGQFSGGKRIINGLISVSPINIPAGS